MSASTASERTPLVGLSLAQGHLLADQLRVRSMYLRDVHCAALAMDEDTTEIDTERKRVLDLRDALGDAIQQTINGLG